VDLIDNAVADWETSTDAMRWTPDAPPEPSKPRVYFAPLDDDGVAGEWVELPGVVSVSMGRIEPDDPPQPQTFHLDTAFGRFTPNRPLSSCLIANFILSREDLRRVVQRTIKAIEGLFAAQRRHRPKPLPIDGAAYRRRTRRRR